MNTTRLSISPNGPTLSRIIAGVWKWGIWGHQLDAQQTLALVETAIEVGITTFDHADIYGGYTNEGDFGKALKLKPSLRQKMELVTKCGIKLLADNRPQHKIKSYDTSREHILWSVENSLRELQTDYIDLLLIHRPSPLMDPDEIAEAVTQLKDQGKIRHFGVSNFTPSQFAMLHSRTPLVTNQVEASVLHRTPFLDGTFDQAIQASCCPMIWSPLGSGKMFTDTEDEQVGRIRKVLERIGTEKGGYGIDQMLLAWLLRHPAKLCPILGTARPERVRAAAKALEISLSREEWFEIWEAAAGEEVP
ncbi:MAG: aldo/keto reductase [Bacteroidota bacterium]